MLGIRTATHFLSIWMISVVLTWVSLYYAWRNPDFAFPNMLSVLAILLPVLFSAGLGIWGIRKDTWRSCPAECAGLCFLYSLVFGWILMLLSPLLIGLFVEIEMPLGIRFYGIFFGLSFAQIFLGLHPSAAVVWLPYWLAARSQTKQPSRKVVLIYAVISGLFLWLGGVLNYYIGLAI